MKRINYTIGVFAVFMLLLASCDNKAKKDATEVKDEVEELAADYVPGSSCLADASWFETDPKTGKRKTPPPKEDKNSVFGNNVTVSNCDFHQWSWQKFLWLTNDDGGLPSFMTNMTQVSTHNIPVTTEDHKIVLASGDDLQATGDILKTNKTYSVDNTSHTVYYSIHVNETLFNEINQYAPMNPSDYADQTFSVGSLELKVAWVDAKAISNADSYFQTAGVIDGTPTTLALLGMHVVGVVYNHPEFVWATFEHDGMVPYYDWEATTDQDVPVVSSTNMLLYKANDVATIANITSNGAGKDSTSVFAVNSYGTPRTAKNAFLEASQKGAENFKNIDEINADVKSKLTDIWNNYYYNGSIWINTATYSYPTEQAQLFVRLGYSIFDPSPGKLPRGSVAAYNITMETYEQLGFTPTSIHAQNTAAMGNCFSCHSAGRGSSLNFSHIFNGAVDSHNDLTTKDTKKKHLAEIQTFINNLKKQ